MAGGLSGAGCAQAFGLHAPDSALAAIDRRAKRLRGDGASGLECARMDSTVHKKGASRLTALGFLVPTLTLPNN